MKGPWAVPDNPSKTTDDRENDVVVHGSLLAEAGRDIVAGMRAALGYKDDPDDDGHNWYPVLGGYGG